ncbi:hypothetical protein ACLK1S_05010 [Escherichia coli]
MLKRRVIPLRWAMQNIKQIARYATDEDNHEGALEVI